MLPWFALHSFWYFFDLLYSLSYCAQVVSGTLKCSHPFRMHFPLLKILNGMWDSMTIRISCTKKQPEEATKKQSYRKSRTKMVSSHGKLLRSTRSSRSSRWWKVEGRLENMFNGGICWCESGHAAVEVVNFPSFPSVSGLDHVELPFGSKGKNTDVFSCTEKKILGRFCEKTWPFPFLGCVLVVKFRDPIVNGELVTSKLGGSRSVTFIVAITLPERLRFVNKSHHLDPLFSAPGFENQRHGEDFAKSGCHKTAEGFFLDQKEKKTEDFETWTIFLGRNSKLRTEQFLSRIIHYYCTSHELVPTGWWFHSDCFWIFAPRLWGCMMQFSADLTNIFFKLLGSDQPSI